MKLITLLSLAAICQVPTIELRNGTKWVDEDQKIYEQNIDSCKKKYPKKPCIARIIKFNRRNYFYLCGPKRGKK